MVGQATLVAVLAASAGIAATAGARLHNTGETRRAGQEHALPMLLLTLGFAAVFFGGVFYVLPFKGGWTDWGLFLAALLPGAGLAGSGSKAFVWTVFAGAVVAGCAAEGLLWLG